MGVCRYCSFIIIIIDGILLRVYPWLLDDNIGERVYLCMTPFYSLTDVNKGYSFFSENENFHLPNIYHRNNKKLI